MSFSAATCTKLGSIETTGLIKVSGGFSFDSTCIGSDGLTEQSQNLTVAEILSLDDTYRALDTFERLLEAIEAVACREKMRRERLLLVLEMAEDVRRRLSSGEFVCCGVVLFRNSVLLLRI
jgi:hypothetical protein